MASTRAVDPQGNEWAVRRRWTHRRLRWRGKRIAGDLLDGGDLASFGADLPGVGVIFTAVALLLVTIGVLMFIVPALILVVDLLIIAAIIGLGLAGRVLFGRPWTVEARQLATGQAYEWKVSGWHASRDLVQTVADQLRATGLPTGGAPTPPGDG